VDQFTLHRDDAVLLAIDIQERLVPVMKYGKQVIDNTNVLIKVAGQMDIPVFITEQYPQGLGRTVPEIEAAAAKTSVFEKVTFSGCTDEMTAALGQLGRKKVIVTGMETHVCVFQTVRGLLGAGYQVFLVQDAVCSRTKENFRNGLALMDAMGAVITNTETVVFDLLKRAATDEFRAALQLIK